VPAACPLPAQRRRMSITYPLEVESCAAADSTSSFAYEFGFADANMAQTSVIACASCREPSR
jgi:hypothetical protein